MALTLLLVLTCAQAHAESGGDKSASPRQRISINRDWRFLKVDSDGLLYDVRPEVRDARDDRPADAMPTEADAVEARDQVVLKPWVLPTGYPFLADPASRFVSPDHAPDVEAPFTQAAFDDSDWQQVNLPHDWATAGPFLTGPHAPVGGSMGRLPSPGIGWYRKSLAIPASDAGRSIFLDVDGAMSYAIVWLNGHLVGGWPYGYASWRVDLTPYIKPGGTNQLAIRLDNPPNSSRWYPGGGIYRNVWLTTVAPVHVGQWGTFVTTRDVSTASATVDLAITIDNDADERAAVEVSTAIYALDADGHRIGNAVAHIEPATTQVPARASATVKDSATLAHPRLWGPPPQQSPHRYLAVTTVRQGGQVVDEYETRFGVRSLRFDPDSGISVNGQRIFIKGANQHHDLGALGAAFNERAAERQLEMLREMGCNAIRMAHNPPAPELLDLADRMGFLVVDEVFDSWERKKTPLDFHLIFPDWHEQDLRALIRRDRNHPSVILWSIGNEVGEQYTGEEGAAIAERLQAIVHEEDGTRPATAAMNFAKPDMAMPPVLDVISLNYQGEGIRHGEAYAGLRGISTPPLYDAFRKAFPDKVILSSENAAALSSRGEYMFPVYDGIGAPVKDGQGGDPQTRQVSAYELYTVEFGSSADKVFAAMEQHSFVAGGFVWSGWDYLGEPSPYYASRSSYFGVIDLAGFPKDRFYLYQAHWRPDWPMAHILPHWTWPERIGQVTPVHVFTSGDAAELFVNGRSLGRKTKGRYEYRLRWDDVIYEPGELKVIAHNNGQPWAEAIRWTAGLAAGLEATRDRARIRADGDDLSFITVRVVDSEGQTCPRARDSIRFSIDGPGQIVATDNGDPTDMVAFPSHERAAFNGLCLVIVRSKPGQTGAISVRARSEGLEPATVSLQAVAEN